MVSITVSKTADPGSNPGTGASPCSPIGRGDGLRSRRLLVRIQPGAPFLLARGRPIAQQLGPVAQWKSSRLSSGRSRVQSPSGSPFFARMRQKVERRALNSRGFRFDSGCGYTRVAQLVGGTSFKLRTVQVRISPRVPWIYGPVAQWIRASVYEAEGCRFESCRDRQIGLCHIL